jgi:hypothetical protein
VIRFALTSAVCGHVDAGSANKCPETRDYIRHEIFEDISGGGWRSSYTGEWLSREVEDEYDDNILQKLSPESHAGNADLGDRLRPGEQYVPPRAEGGILPRNGPFA